MTKQDINWLLNNIVTADSENSTGTWLFDEQRHLTEDLIKHYLNDTNVKLNFFYNRTFAILLISK
jgi:hypothetical protein